MSEGKILGNEPLDGPTENIMHYMASYNFNAPPEWRGYRILKEK